ncbi:hypothetical protein F4556_006953 [Kitasatospora gansuensis]|uniref:Uncharacterized protein n=1 Tax=Kitasatospora gansuensis TaxID=258050 RepID=A0A7W7WLM6_9ACTN|nr:DUF6000 family protein [Kitasatospora gansuensis]MBB4951418.1 hypothetical protein [Kitasatospora gansuensis]
MRDVRSDPELQELVRRFVTPDRRYLRLGGSLHRLSEVERSTFVRDLAQTAHEITPAELGILFEAGWRERKTAAWLVAVAHRTEFRDHIGRLLLASGGPYAGAAYCVALAKFGTAADAELLAAYLDHYLSRPDLDYDQPIVLGTLLYLDGLLGSESASRFIVLGGAWDQWLEARGVAALNPHACQQSMQRLCAFVDTTTEAFDPRQGRAARSQAVSEGV